MHHQPSAPCQTFQRLVVKHHHFTASAQTRVEFHAVCTLREGKLEGLEGVLRCIGAGAAVAENAHGLEGLGLGPLPRQARTDMGLHLGGGR